MLEERTDSLTASFTYSTDFLVKIYFIITSLGKYSGVGGCRGDNWEILLVVVTVKNLKAMEAVFVIFTALEILP